MEENERMTSWLVAFALVGGSVLSSPSGDGVEIRPGTMVEFGGAAACARVLSARDTFVQAMSPFDRSARLKTDKDVSEAEYLAFAARQARDWSSAEQARVRPILESFRLKTAQLNLRLPPTMLLLTTTGLEEGGAAYCRGTSIVIPKAVIDKDPAKLESLIFHELFHVYRTYNPAMRRDLYKIIGFEVCPEIVLPPELQARKITNPDAPLLDSFIRLRDRRSVRRRDAGAVGKIRAIRHEGGRGVLRQHGVQAADPRRDQGRLSAGACFPEGARICAIRRRFPATSTRSAGTRSTSFTPRRFSRITSF